MTRREVPDQHQRGLYCIVQPTGAKVFAVRYRFDGRPRKLTLSPASRAFMRIAILIATRCCLLTRSWRR